MTILPASTNHAYRGHIAAAYIIGLLSLLIVVPGGIHYFLPYGGAGTIAGRAMDDKAPLIIGLFAWAGATQIVWGLTLLAVATRYRNFLPAAASLLLLERGLMAFAAWVFKATDAPKPPGAYGMLIFLPLIILALYLSWPRRTD